MLISSLIYLLISNAVTLRQDKSLLLSRLFTILYSLLWIKLSDYIKYEKLFLFINLTTNWYEKFMSIINNNTKFLIVILCLYCFILFTVTFLYQVDSTMLFWLIVKISLYIFFILHIK